MNLQNPRYSECQPASERILPQSTDSAVALGVLSVAERSCRSAVNVSFLIAPTTVIFISLALGCGFVTLHPHSEREDGLELSEPSEKTCPERAEQLPAAGASRESA